MTTDHRTIDDLVTFARIEQQSGDIEPWAATLRAHHLADRGPKSSALASERSLWMVHLYNATDDLGSAVAIARAAPYVGAWAAGKARPREVAAEVFLGQERRNLRGGRIIQRLDSYAGALTAGSQHRWIEEALVVSNRTGRFDNFNTIMPYLQHIWGVGRLAAFEWAEFLAKVGGYPIETTDGALWESSGPRQSIERLFNGGEPAADRNWLSDHAQALKSYLATQGVELSWWDFETVICDFNVMRKGRYYPGKHLAMISEEIEGMPEPERSAFRAAYREVIPEGWRDLPPGADAELARSYARTGRILTPEGAR